MSSSAGLYPAAVRSKPFDVQRDLEGFTNRDLFSTTFIARHDRGSLAFTSTTAPTKSLA